MTINRSRIKKIRHQTKVQIGKKTENNQKTKTQNPQPEKNPDVILDFEYKEGLLFILIENIGEDSAYDTTITFNKKMLGMQKTKNISSLRIFQALRFLPPRKKIKILVDVFHNYLESKQPLQINTSLSFTNKERKKFQNIIRHDLSIYKDMTEVYDTKN